MSSTCWTHDHTTSASAAVAFFRVFCLDLNTDCISISIWRFAMHSQSSWGSSVEPVSKAAALKRAYCSHRFYQVQGHLVILWLTCDFRRLPYGFTDLNLSQTIEWRTEELESLFHLSDNQHQSDFGFSISEDESRGMKQFFQYQSIYSLYDSFI